MPILLLIWPLLHDCLFGKNNFITYSVNIHCLIGWSPLLNRHISLKNMWSFKGSQPYYNTSSHIAVKYRSHRPRVSFGKIWHVGFLIKRMILKNNVLILMDSFMEKFWKELKLYNKPLYCSCFTFLPAQSRWPPKRIDVSRACHDVFWSQQ